MTVRRIAFFLCLALFAATGPLPLVYTCMQSVADARWANMYDGKSGCDLSISVTAVNASKWCDVRRVQIVGRTPTIFDAGFNGTYSIDLEDDAGRTYTADLVPTSAAMRSWMESGAPAPTQAVFFANAPVLVELDGAVVETQSNPDYQRADAWFNAWRYGGITLVESAVLGLLTLVIRRERKSAKSRVLRNAVYRRTG